MGMGGRIPGRRLTVSGQGTALITFGPFTVGECCKRILAYFDNAAPSAGDTIQIELSVTHVEPVSAATFANGGRLLTEGSPRFPVGLRGAELPVNWVANDEERWLNVLVTEIANDATEGSVWADVEADYDKAAFVEGS